MNTPAIITPNIASATNNEKNFNNDIRPTEESFYEPPLRDTSSQKFTQ